MSKKIKCVCYARFGNSSQLEIEEKKSALKDYANTHNVNYTRLENLFIAYIIYLLE